MLRAIVCALICPGLPAAAEPPVIQSAEASVAGTGITISATISHPDTGWDHYADGFRVELPDGTVLAVRELLHPHVEEQPFTRSARNVQVPAGVTALRVRARCNETGWAEETYTVNLPR